MDNIPSNYPNNAQVNKAIKTKYLAQGHKHVGASGARTRNLVRKLLTTIFYHKCAVYICKLIFVNFYVAIIFCTNVYRYSILQGVHE